MYKQDNLNHIHKQKAEIDQTQTKTNNTNNFIQTTTNKAANSNPNKPTIQHQPTKLSSKHPRNRTPKFNAKHNATTHS